MDVVKDYMKRVDMTEEDAGIGWDEGRWFAVATCKGNNRKKTVQP